MIQKIKQKTFNWLKKQGIYVRTTRHQPFLQNVRAAQQAHFAKRSQLPRRALVSYITRPFTLPDYFTHTNGFESQIIADVLTELGFVVDVIDYFNDVTTPQYSAYDLVFGFGEPFENSFLAADCRAVRIYYGTGCHPLFQNAASIARLRDCHAETGVWLENSARFIDKSYPMSTTLVDAVFAKGNDFVGKTYRMHFAGIVRTVETSSFLLHKSSPDSKNFAEARRHFLWFGSAGLLHKGLDLVLKTFAHRTDLTLHVCGHMAREPLFTQVFHRELYETPHIITHDFVDIQGEKFAELMQQCAFAIFPSASEGGSPSQVNLMMNGGLIPILTENCGLDVAPFGIEIADLTVESVDAAVSKALELSDAELRQRTQQSLDYARQHHTLDHFRETMKAHFLEVVP